MNNVNWTDEIEDFVCHYIAPERIQAMFDVHPRDMYYVCESLPNPGNYGLATDRLDDLAKFLYGNAHMFSPEVIERIRVAQAVFALREIG